MDFPGRQAAVALQADAGGDLFCPACGYNLRGTRSAHCPECGLAVDRELLAASRIPWVHRRRIGRWKAYWRTNFLAMFHPARLAEEMERPVSLSDAQRFRHVTVLAAFVPLAAWAEWFAEHELHFSVGGGPRFDLGWLLEYGAVAAPAFSLWLLVLMVSGAGSYFFHPRRLPIVRQNRAVALSYYACAPLAWLFVPATLLLGTLFSDTDFGGFEQKIVVWSALMAGATCGLIVLWFWVGSVLMLRHTTACGRTRAIVLAISLPLTWAVLSLICWAIIAAVIFVALVILSLR